MATYPLNPAFPVPGGAPGLKAIDYVATALGAALISRPDFGGTNGEIAKKAYDMAAVFLREGASRDGTGLYPVVLPRKK